MRTNFDKILNRSKFKFTTVYNLPIKRMYTDKNIFILLLYYLVSMYLFISISLHKFIRKNFKNNYLTSFINACIYFIIFMYITCHNINTAVQLDMCIALFTTVEFF